jgi:hypothetical protein
MTACGAPGEMERWSSETGSDEDGFSIIDLANGSDFTFSGRTSFAMISTFTSGEGGGSAPPQLNSGVSSQQAHLQLRSYSISL